MTPAIDALAAALVTGGAAGTRAGSGAAVASSPAAGSPEALDAAALSYLVMGRARDRRNLPFLRTALRAEAEPLLRLAVAEAAYRSDPDADAARRGLLETTAPALPAAALERLLALGRLGDPPPVLAALGDLAGEGNATAIGRLLELAPAELSAPLRAALAGVLGEVADAAPTELRLSLGAAAPPVRAAAQALLGDRLPPSPPAPPAPTPATIGPTTPRDR
jgi:D-alanyl-D-alanine carboxypeptidase/D-alanyl-D-alanine-endopeptidase (penicillin-binding protein 4)